MSSTGHIDPAWREALAPYTTPDFGRSMLDLATSVVPYLLGWVAMYLSLDIGYWLTALLAFPTAGFAVRTFIVFHDCAHGSFFRSKRANVWVGRVLGVMVLQPFTEWRHSHAVHHSSAGDLDRRGHGDVETMTVREYLQAPTKKQLAYRLFRNPLVMYGLGPFFAMAITPRFTNPRMRPRMRNSVLLNDLAIVAILAGLCFWLGPLDVLLVQAPLVFLAGGAGIWLFYVQHQFEDVYWESGEKWSYAAAALEGSSYLKLPQPLQFFTGNIGLHHVHHLSARVPNYKLQACHDELEIFDSVPVLSLWDGLKALRLKLYDEDAGRLITWRELAQKQAARPASVTA
ncbi:fatty acid desaturase [Thermoleophilia bacterium SCSIO 60948]|nr:fatty acid desaturase [Thermoleophilia bacterium SCSIO 60948]